MSEHHGTNGNKALFTGKKIPVQLRLPEDLIQSIRLSGVAQNRSISDVVLACLTSAEQIDKAWVNFRRAS